MRRLGEVECRDCGYVREPTGPVGVAPVPAPAPDGAAGRSAREAVPGSLPGPAPDLGETPGLAEEVELALARVLGRAWPPRQDRLARWRAPERVRWPGHSCLYRVTPAGSGGA